MTEAARVVIFQRHLQVFLNQGKCFTRSSGRFVEVEIHVITLIRRGGKQLILRLEFTLIIAQMLV